MLKRPFVVTKLGQLARLVRESHANPIAGEQQQVRLVGAGELTGVTFLGHSSFLVQMAGAVRVDRPGFRDAARRPAAAEAGRREAP